jgi:hypothetical protein
MAERLAGLSFGELEQAARKTEQSPRPKRREKDVFMTAIIA